MKTFFAIAALAFTAAFADPEINHEHEEGEEPHGHINNEFVYAACDWVDFEGGEIEGISGALLAKQEDGSIFHPTYYAVGLQGAAPNDNYLFSTYSTAEHGQIDPATCHLLGAEFPDFIEYLAFRGSDLNGIISAATLSFGLDLPVDVLSENGSSKFTAVFSEANNEFVGCCNWRRVLLSEYLSLLGMNLTQGVPPVEPEEPMEEEMMDDMGLNMMDMMDMD